MSVPLMLGGVEFLLEAGAPQLAEEPIGGETELTMSNGDLVTMTRWKKEAGSISLSGWIQPGIDGLNFSQVMELRSTQVSVMQLPDLVFNLPSTPRPDQQPWAFALVGGVLVPAVVSTAGRIATVTAVPGASLYQVWWMPVYQVKARKTVKSQDSASGTQSVVINWREA